MLAVQRPTSALPPSMLSRPSHSRAPSAPVVVRPTPTPGIFSLSKSPKNPQQQQPSQRSSPRSKAHKSPKPASAQAQPRDEVTTPEKPSADAKAVTKTPASDKPRGRQQRQPKDKVGVRSASLSSARPGRRPAHQPSPSPQTRIPSQAEAPSDVHVDSRSQRPNRRDAAVDPSDPFLVLPTPNIEASSPESSPAKGKVPVFRPPPQLAQRPSGKLAHRRQQSAQVPPSPTPAKATAAPRRSQRQPRAPKEPKQAAKHITNSELFLASSAMARRPSQRRATTGLPVAAWDSFPICDDSADFGDESDDTPPTTPIRESASVPPKMAGQGGQWQSQGTLDDGPRTAPLSSAFAYPFRPSTPSPTPTPGQRRRKHQRVPSEGVFNMSTDDSSSEEALEPFQRLPLAFPKRRDAFESPRLARAQAAETIGTSSSAPAAGYYAGSMFQNSPSPDDLPPPTFRA
ncbi:hypothetical protein CERSUDRAFT_124721 [Gelatoporia subvermispora B]|uniref:Uncharacterized protein n=1 Tax=Ceriporiopsis subvermispora (strain B) TaxID=914234 RepID=M2PH80_CERS8|nr:hypothetical protein CERSUDRAFT_124721 [Gelatoporia subvermispora B]